MRALAAGLALTLAGCGGLTFEFGRKVSNEELILRDELRAYYSEVAETFAAGNAEALSQLFDPGISHPMTQEQIRAWGDDFFKTHGPAGFKVVNLEFEKVGHIAAEVVLTYRVVTRDGQGSFAGVERDRLVKRGRRWSVTAWDKLDHP